MIDALIIRGRAELRQQKNTPLNSKKSDPKAAV